MVRTFCEELLLARGWRAELGLWARSVSDVLITAPQEHYHVIQQDVRYALRTLVGQPGFTAVAVLSLALGIGANVAIFSLIDSVLLRMLPVQNPQELVLLTDPGSSGSGTGASTGERNLMTYEEFLQLRDQTRVLSGLMAVQSDVLRVPVRIGGGEPTEVRARMVSAEYFATLGVPAMMGRVLSVSDGPKPALAVVNHSF